jgi:HSP20 family protein
MLFSGTAFVLQAKRQGFNSERRNEMSTRIQTIAIPFENMCRDFDTVVNRLFNPESQSALAPYPVDVREDGEQLVIEAELPGFKKEEVEITSENQTLTISANRAAAQPKDPTGYLLNERQYTRFLRSFTLPPSVDIQKVDAKLENGILTVTLNKREETKPRKIEVK